MPTVLQFKQMIRQIENNIEAAHDQIDFLKRIIKAIERSDLSANEAVIKAYILGGNTDIAARILSESDARDWSNNKWTKGALTTLIRSKLDDVDPDLLDLAQRMLAKNTEISRLFAHAGACWK
jgi:hypothetical protein